MQTHGYWSVVNHRWNFQMPSAVQDSLDRTDDARGAGAKQLEKPVFVQRLQDVTHENRPLHDAELAPLGRQLQQALSSDAGQDEAGRQRRSHEFLVAFLVYPECEEVHRSNLGHLVVGTVQPQNLETSVNVASQLLRLYQVHPSLFSRYICVGCFCPFILSE